MSGDGRRGRSERNGTVLHLVERWLPPSETFVHDLVSRSRRPGAVVSIRRPENLDRFPHPSITRVPRWADRLPPTMRRRAVTAMLLTVAARHDVGLVHVHHSYRLFEAVGLAKRRSVPLVVSAHGHDVTGHVWREPAYYAGVLERADAVIVPSEFLAGHAVAAGARAETVHVIPSGVDTSWFNPTPLPNGTPELLFVGRFVEKKGIDVLLEAWPAVRAKVPEARLRLLGYGPLEALARSAGAGTEVVIAPDRAAVRDAMRRARVVVTPSRTAGDDAAESLLLVNLEAQASGRPVVTTDHGGIPEYVEPGRTALVVPEGDAGALADALVAVLTDDDLATRLATAGPVLAGRFDVAQCTGRVDELYDNLTARQMVPPPRR